EPGRRIEERQVERLHGEAHCPEHLERRDLVQRAHCEVVDGRPDAELLRDVLRLPNVHALASLRIDVDEPPTGAPAPVLRPGGVVDVDEPRDLGVSFGDSVASCGHRPPTGCKRQALTAWMDLTSSGTAVNRSATRP